MKSTPLPEEHSRPAATASSSVRAQQPDPRAKGKLLSKAGAAARATLGQGTAAAASPVPDDTALACCLADIDAEFAPHADLERAFARDMARQAAALETWSKILLASMEQAASVSEILLGANKMADSGQRALAAACSSAAVQLAEANCQRRARAFYRAFEALRCLQAERAARARAAERHATKDPFGSEDDCQAYLLKRLRGGLVECQSCGSCRGHYLADRRVWQCHKCRRQTGLRAGTVMADSPLPLTTWFTAIRALLNNPETTTSELAALVNLNRLGTVRRIAQRVRAAIASPNASQLLAGLDVIYAGADGDAAV